MERRVPLKRTGWLRQRTPLKRSGRLAPISKRNGHLRRIPKEVMDALVFRSCGQCERIIDGIRCYRVAVDPHHILKVSQGGKHTLENLKHLCRKDHNFTENEPSKAFAEGLLRKASRFDFSLNE